MAEGDSYQDEQRRRAEADRRAAEKARKQTITTSTIGKMINRPSAQLYPALEKILQEIITFIAVTINIANNTNIIRIIAHIGSGPLGQQGIRASIISPFQLF